MADAPGPAGRASREQEVERLAEALGGGWRIEHGVMPVVVLTEIAAQRVVGLIEPKLRPLAQRLIDAMSGQEVCFCCGERLDMGVPQQGHTEECSFAALEAALDRLSPSGEGEEQGEIIEKSTWLNGDNVERWRVIPLGHDKPWFPEDGEDLHERGGQT